MQLYSSWFMHALKQLAQTNISGKPRDCCEQAVAVMFTLNPQSPLSPTAILDEIQV